MQATTNSSISPPTTATARGGRRLMTTALLVVVAALAVVPATSSAKATGPGTYTVIPKVAYPGAKPGGPFNGHMVKGQTFIVTRLSPSGEWAYGHGVGKASAIHGWLRSVSLKRRTN